MKLTIDYTTYKKYALSITLMLLSLTQLSSAQTVNANEQEANEPTASQTRASTTVDLNASMQQIHARIGKDRLQELYQQHGMQPIWIDGNTLNQNTQDLLAIIDASEAEGLIAENYHHSELKSLATQIENLDAQQQQRFDLLLSDAFLSYTRDMVEGRPELKKSDSQWLLKGRSIDEIATLNASLESGTIKQDLENLSPKYRIYNELKKSLPKFEALAKAQTEIEPVPSGHKLVLGSSNEAVPLLRRHLIEHGFLDQSFLDGNTFDQNVEKAVKAFQAANSLDDDGKVGKKTLAELNFSAQDRLDQIKINMERWRWMPESFGDHYLIVDITGFEYFVVRNGAEVLRNKTVVGMAQRPTPVFTSDMKYIVFSPYWHVPYSIAVKDKLPRLKRDPYALERSGIRIYDRSNNEVDPGMIDWNSYGKKSFPYRLKQDPGVANALGRVKFMFPNSYAIYLHDTPQKSLFKRRDRTFSSGCIRVEHPLSLAAYLLQDKKEWTKERISAAYNGKKERTVHLSKDMVLPVYVLYTTAWLDANDQIAFRPDIYNRDKAMISALRKLQN